MQNFDVVSHTVCVDVEGLENFGNAEAPPPLDGALLTLGLTLLPRMSYTKFRRSMSNCMGVRRESQKFGGRWGPTPFSRDRI